MDLSTTTVARFLRFALIGGLVFVFDAMLFILLLHFGAPPGGARLMSVAMALLLSWWLNRSFTFKAVLPDKWVRELLGFVASQLPGAAVNAMVSILLFTGFGLFRHYPWLAVAVGSIAGLVVNFIMAQRFVFKRAGT